MRRAHDPRIPDGDAVVNRGFDPGAIAATAYGGPSGGRHALTILTSVGRCTTSGQQGQPDEREPCQEMASMHSVLRVACFELQAVKHLEVLRHLIAANVHLLCRHQMDIAYILG
jgi:hypothetical protein